MKQTYVIVVVLVVMLSFCGLKDHNEIYGKWVVLYYQVNDTLIYPDTFHNLSYYPQIYILEDGRISIPKAYDINELPVAKFRLTNKGDSTIMTIYESPDSAMYGDFGLRVFRDRDIYEEDKESTYLELYSPELYLLLMKNIDY